MSRAPVVVKGRLWRDGALVAGALGIDPATGRITAVARELEGDVVHDFGAQAILPGAVDIHVHFRDPGHPEKEDFESGTRAALFGGVTAIYDMPNTQPPTTTVAAYEAKRAIAQAKSLVDWGLWAGATRPGAELDALAARAPGIKIYMGESTGGVTWEDPALLSDALVSLARAGFHGVVAFHAEAGHVLGEENAAHRDEPGLAGHDARRPVRAELAALDELGAALDDARRQHGRLPFKIHIAHAASPATIARARLLFASVGVTPHHLLLHHGLPLAARGRLNPPLRDAAAASLLAAAFSRGEATILESDHAPHTAAEKSRAVADAPSGLPGVETTRAVLLPLALDGLIPFARVVDATSLAPARLMGIPKGGLHAGLDADLAVYDLDRRTTVTAALLHSRCGWSPYEGHPALFPTDVFVRGIHALAQGNVLVKPGRGHEIAFPARRAIAPGSA